MEERTNEILEQEIRKRIEELSEISAKDEGYGAAVESLAKLYKLKLEEDRNNNDYGIKYYQQELDKEKLEESKANAKKQIFENRLNLGVTNGLKLALFTGDIIFKVIWLSNGLKFEETGSFGSKVFLDLTKGFLKDKK